jgi:endonuclease/exonuclease/phosphatase family metal-dependent hydrolase
MAEFRIATFNLENFDETDPGARPSLEERIRLMRPQIHRLHADVVVFQEVNGQERPGALRDVHALRQLLEDTELEGANIASTQREDGAVFDERNLVVATTRPIVEVAQLSNDLVGRLSYRRLTASPPDEAAVEITVERPILYAQVELEGGRRLHVINVHLKSKIPTNIPGQKIDNFTWRSTDAWAEGSFISSMKRMSQAVEVRRLVDQILDGGPEAFIVVVGDFNADPDEVPVQTIRGDIENTGNPELVHRILVPIEHTVPESARYTLFHQGKGQMLDHMLITRNLLAHYRGSEIHNEVLHDESAAFAVDRKYPESDHAPVVATFFFD